MATVADKKKDKPETRQRYLNPQGTEVKTREEALAAPEAVTATLALELHNGTVTFAMEVKYAPNTYPFVVTGGTIRSGICGAPWQITGGFLGDTLRLDAKRQGTGNCANKITVVGEYQNPPSWRGTYGFDGAASSFKHTTMYQC
ncbi:hypothetical protein [Streptomyces sp. KR80]|uniref:hypothetical protein n=1 Tax=Streptomyces sp. KR80 TaxID=3457426 RepID=UPI003FD1E675